MLVKLMLKCWFIIWRNNVSKYSSQRKVIHFYVLLFINIESYTTKNHVNDESIKNKNNSLFAFNCRNHVFLPPQNKFIKWYLVYLVFLFQY